TPEYAAENSSQPLLNVCISFGILETFFIISFIFSWHYNRRNSNNSKTFYLLILLGYIFCFAGVVSGILMITIAGAGYHVQTVPDGKIRTMLKLVKVHELVYIASIPLPKIAILCLYLRLFRGKKTRIAIYGTGLIIVGTFLFGIVSAFANCRPFHWFWDRKVKSHCTMDIMTAFRFYSIPNMAADVIVLLIPLPALRKLQVGVMTKVGVYLTFLSLAMGLLTAILRFISFMNDDFFHDLTYLAPSMTSWTIIEPGVYLIAATMPTLRPLIRQVFKEVNKV
ncbi:hypothetical protein B0J11DRAFT_419656, partial [Dendryphion nanum]